VLKQRAEGNVRVGGALEVLFSELHAIECHDGVTCDIVMDAVWALAYHL
jgi:hypothetical protein